MGQFYIDDKPVPFTAGQTIMQAALDAEIYIPHLCFHPEFRPHGSCRVCLVDIGGRMVAACTYPAQEELKVLNITPQIQRQRMEIIEMLFVEGNHTCPSCEKSGACNLQSVAEFCGMLSPPYQFLYPTRDVDASHPDYMLDYNRCILCELCVRASRDVDGKSIFSITGRGHNAHLQIEAKDSKLGNSTFEKTDRAATVCPVGVFLPKGKGFDAPIGRRLYDIESIDKRQVKK
jgi:[NiFe] hydrogenase diaphorase moiety small subunit